MLFCQLFARSVQIIKLQISVMWLPYFVGDFTMHGPTTKVGGVSDCG
jgi:hypothetical protein